MSQTKSYQLLPVHPKTKTVTGPTNEAPVGQRIARANADGDITIIMPTGNVIVACQKGEAIDIHESATGVTATISVTFT